MDRHIKEVLDHYLKEGKISSGFTNEKIRKIWASAMGPSVVNQTKKIFLNKDELRIKIESSVLKYELFQNAEKIKELFNTELGEDRIKSVRFI